MIDSEDLNYLEDLENLYNMNNKHNIEKNKKYDYYYVELCNDKIMLNCISETKEKFLNVVINNYIDYTKKFNAKVKFYKLVAPGELQCICMINKGELFTY